MSALHGPVDDLRSKLGLPAGAGWSGVTSAVLIPQQQRLGLPTTGRFDPPTALAFKYYSDDKILNPEQLAYVRGGPPVGTFSRDLATSSAQVPWWLWTLLGVGCLGVAGYTLWRAKKRKV